MRKSSKLVKFSIAVLVLLFCVNIYSFAQEKTIKGAVKDSNGDPLVGVTVMAKGTTKATLTDMDGKYTLSVPANVKTIVAKYVGMENNEQEVKGSIINFSMKDASSSLDEVVVIGYGTMKKKDLTGAVSSFGEDVLKHVSVTNAESALAGRLAGVSVVTTEGSPDATVNIRVRGGGSISQDNSPLYVVDGFQVSSISDIPPGDIESVTVLKDASSTAIYGAKGANGVILIQTKGGKEGKTVVNFNSSIGFNKMYNATPVLSPYEYVYLQRELDPGDDASFFSKYGRWEDIDIYKSKEGNDWQKKLFDRTGVKQSYNVSVSGGDPSLRYSISYTHDDESYVMRTSNYKRDNLNVKIDKDINKNLKLEFNPKLSSMVINGASVSSGSKLRDCVKYPSIGTLASMSEEDLEGDEGYDVDNISNLNDPFYNIANEYKKQVKFTNSYNVALTWKIFDGLSARAEGTYGFLRNRTDDIYLKNTGEANTYGGYPVAYRYYWNGSNYTIRGILSYIKKIKRHNFDATAGCERVSSGKDKMTIHSDYFPIDYTADNILAMWNNGTAEPTYTDIEEDSRTESAFARINYNYENRYYLTLTGRYDGTNVFAPGKKWGFFPAGSASWRLSEEKFMAGTKDWLSNLKIRVSYGTAGNARLGSSYWRQTYSPVTSSSKLYYIDETAQSSLQPSSVLRNEDLTWETNYSSNLGFDIGLLNDKINLTVELYKDVTKNLIMQVDIPSNSGYSTQYQNLGQTSNRGAEFTVNANLFKNKDFYLDMNFNISFNKNKVDKLYGTHDDEMIVTGGGATIGSDNYRILVGKEVGLMWGYVSDGMYSFDDFTFDSSAKKWVLNTTKDDYVDCTGVLANSGNYFGPGHMKLKDLNSDHTIDADNDRKIIGRGQPKHTGGLSIMTGWKGLDLTALFNWSYGNDVFNASKLDYNSYSGSKRYQNMTTEMCLANRFTTIDPSTGNNIYYGDYADPELLQQLNANKKYWHPMENATVMSSWAIEDGSFLRLSTLSLGYTLPQKLTKQFAVKSLRIYGTANNVFCLTKYSGQDPEVNTSSSKLVLGYDNSAYPKSKSYIMGLSLTF